MAEQIEFCGQQWYPGNDHDSGNSYIQVLTSDLFGELHISDTVYNFMKNSIELHYKFISLCYESHLMGLKCSIVGNNEKPINWRDSHLYRSCTIDQFLNNFPANILEIQQRSLLSLYREYPNYGQRIHPLYYYHFFVQNEQELGFILEAMISKNWLSGEVKYNGDGTLRLIYPFKITLDGFSEIEKFINSTRLSKVFIAMSFNETMNKARDAIKQAIQDVGFQPVRIDEKEHINLITMEIQYEIRNSGLVIADATGQNQGAYFEAGYAIGLNIPVIWCCRKDEEKKLHFDIRQYNNILWTDENDLYERLKKGLWQLPTLINCHEELKFVY
ncbi:hypothetical protein LQZ19_16295 [Treponema primitia]|uniref:hypothetical protein n=1 Tax=Treponema primitia TaxID=88058 RepID=UPI00398042FB